MKSQNVLPFKPLTRTQVAHVMFVQKTIAIQGSRGKIWMAQAHQTHVVTPLRNISAIHLSINPTHPSIPTNPDPHQPSWTDGRTDGRTDGWMDGWTDGRPDPSIQLGRMEAWERLCHARKDGVEGMAGGCQEGEEGTRRVGQPPFSEPWKHEEEVAKAKQEG